MCVCFDLVKLGIRYVPGTPSFLEAFYTLATVLKGCVTPFPSFIEDVGEEGLLAVRSDLRVYRILCKRGEC